MKKPRILVLTDCYLPGFKGGGPVRSLSACISAFGSQFEWMVVCPDRDLGENSPYAGVRPNAWVTVGGSQVLYGSPALLRPISLVRLIKDIEPDLIYANSFFSFRMSIVPAIAKRLGIIGANLLIAPRGEFSTGALSLKAYKKKTFLWIARLFGLYRGVKWHATSPMELGDLKLTLGVREEDAFVAPNIAVRSESDLTLSGEEGCGSSLRVVFLSRISRMKNLDFALQVLGSVTTPVRFSVYGPVEDEVYLDECRAIASRMPKNVCVEFLGPVAPQNTVSEISKHDLFILPTMGENFGHAIVEAWSAGVPVLISDRTPWRQLAREGVGWDLPLQDASGFTRIIESLSDWSPEQWVRVAQQCRKKAASLMGDEGLVNASAEMFRACVSGAETTN